MIFTIIVEVIKCSISFLQVNFSVIIFVSGTEKTHVTVWIVEGPLRWEFVGSKRTVSYNVESINYELSAYI